MQMLPHVIWWPNLKIEASSKFVDNKRSIKNEAVKKD
jgi:hypothetical protein